MSLRILLFGNYISPLELSAVKEVVHIQEYL